MSLALDTSPNTSIELFAPAAPEFAPASIDVKPLLPKLVQHVKAYSKANTARSVVELGISLSGYALFSLLVVASFVDGDYWLLPLLTLPAAGFLIRLFIIQHDCGHGSFFNNRKLNNGVGRFISVLTFTPYDFWRRSHNLHHAHSGNLERRGIGGVDTVTVAEYKALSPRSQFLYRLYRNPAFLLLVLAPLNILLFQRVPPGRSMPYIENYDSMTAAECLPSIMGLNVALLLTYGAFGYFVGWQALFFAYLPIVYLTAIIGGWLFYIQHQFEDTFWKDGKEWSFQEAAIMSSSYYDLPPLLQWFSGSIGLHHLHHFNAKIPNYKLQACLDAMPELKSVNRMTLAQSFRCLRWALWDSEQQKMVGFKDVKLA